MRKYLRFSLLLVLTGFVFTTGWAQHEHEPKHEEVGGEISKHEEHEEMNAEFIIHHVTDHYSWDVLHAGDTKIEIPLPIIVYGSNLGFKTFLSNHLSEGEYEGLKINHETGKLEAIDGSSIYDFSITKNIAGLLLGMIVLLIVLLTTAKRYKKRGANVAPKGIQSWIEPVVLFVRDEIAIPNIGHKHHKKFMPYLLTVFFLILVLNLLGLIPFFPGGFNMTGNIGFTGVIALATFILFIAVANKEYWKHVLAMPGVPKFILIILTPVEIIGMFVKPTSLAIRLFANITGGHILVLSIVTLGIVMQSYAVGAVSTLFGVFIMCIELLVAFLQAFIFTLLSSIYIGQAVAEHDHH